MNVELLGNNLPAVRIYDLGITVVYKQQITITLDQYIASEDAQAYVDRGLLIKLSGPDILPRTLTETDVDPQTFNIRQHAVVYDHLHQDLQDMLAGGNRIKKACLVATTSPGDINTDFAAGQTVDTLVLQTSDRILIKDQTDPVENGIYDVQATGRPVRSQDAYHFELATSS